MQSSRLVSRAVLGVSLLVLFARCGGSPAVTCQTTSCSGGGKTYRICSNLDASVTYDLGGQSCTCPSGDGTQCQTCAMELAAYCEAGGAGGTGGVTGTGGSGGGSAACTTTFSGAFSATYSPCAVTVAYVPAGGLWTVSTAGNALPGTTYSWTGMTFALPGQPAAGTYDQTQTMAASSEVTDQGSSNPPVWLAGYGNGTSFGSASLTITSLGTSIDTGSGTLYQTPHGTWTGTLVDQNANTALPDVLQTITF